MSCVQTFGFEATLPLLPLLLLRAFTLSVGVTNELLWSRVAVVGHPVSLSLSASACCRGRSGRSFLHVAPLDAIGTGDGRRRRWRVAGD